MRNASSSGWRPQKPTPSPAAKPATADKKVLFQAAHKAGRALKLPSSARFVLDQLVGVFDGVLVENRMLVWPSNDFLVKRTGLSERSVRYSLKRLIDLGLILGKDSPNGKRFAQRSPRGQISKAYGFDLSPLLERLPEFTNQVQAIEDKRRMRGEVLDELTIHRRSAQELLRTLAETLPSIDVNDLTARAAELVRVAPRRSGAGSPDDVRDAWRTIREEAEGRFHAASGGKVCRHKDNNTNAPDESCNNANDNPKDPQRTSASSNADDLRTACPEAMQFIGDVRSDRDLIMGVSRMRGAFGVSASGWEKAILEIGALCASATLVYVIEMQARRATGSDPVENPGGYFRAMVRLIKAGRFDLTREILEMKAHITRSNPLVGLASA